MQFTTSQLAQLLGATLEGADDGVITTLSPLDDAAAGSLCFLIKANLAHLVPSSAATAIVVDRNYRNDPPASAALLRVENPGKVFLGALQMVSQLHPEPQGIDPRAHVDPTAIVGEGAYIGPGAYVGAGAVVGAGARIYPGAYVGDRVRIGAGTTLYPNVTIYRDCTLGEGCILHAGVSIGADGFGFVPLPDGSRHKIPHVGTVEIGNGVEIGANSCVDRATMGVTRIADGVKIDNLVMIGHNTRIGEHTVLAGFVGISGSCKIGSQVIMAGQVGLVDHVEIADKVTIGAQAGVTKSLKEVGGIYRGSPAQKIRDQIRMEAHQHQLPETIPALHKRLAELEQRLATLEAPQP